MLESTRPREQGRLGTSMLERPASAMPVRQAGALLQATFEQHANCT